MSYSSALVVLKVAKKNQERKGSRWEPSSSLARVIMNSSLPFGKDSKTLETPLV